MYLYINTTDKAVCTVALVDHAGVRTQKSESAEQKSSELLLSLIDAALRETGMRMQDMRGIGVAAGPGSFTALRIGVVTANALAYGLGIPVYGISAITAHDVYDAIARGTPEQIVLPAYGADPTRA